MLSRKRIPLVTYGVALWGVMYALLHAPVPPPPVPVSTPALAAATPQPSPPRVAQWIKGDIPGIDTGAIEADLIRIRQLTFRHDVPAATQDKAALLKVLAHDPDEPSPEEQYASLRVFGFVPPGFDVQKFRLDLLASQIGGYYDPRTKRFNVIEQGGGPSWLTDIESGAMGTLMGFNANAIITIHEMDHALTDQYFDILSIENSLKHSHNDDRDLAATALIEGDATWLMMQYAVQGLATGALSLDDWTDEQMRQFTDQATAEAGGSLGKIDGHPVPLFYSRTLVFPYFAGLRFIHYLRCLGEGWNMVNQAWGDVPQSTQQVLHPERYVGDRAVPLHPTWKAPFRPVAGWTLVAENTLGEYLTTVFFEQNLNDPSWQLAAHWCGDRYRIYRRGHNLALLWTSVWDGPAAAGTFADRVTQVFGPHGRMDHRLAGGFRIEHHGAVVNLLYGSTPALASALWPQRGAVRFVPDRAVVKVHVDPGGIEARLADPPNLHERLLTNTATADFALHGTEWSSAAQGVALQLPTGWQVDPDVSGTTVFRARGAHIGLSVTLPHRSPNVAADLQSGLTEWMDAPVLQRRCTDLVDGAPIEQFDYEGNKRGGQGRLHVRWATATHRGRTVYLAVYWTPAETPDGGKQAAAIVHSLRLF